MMMLVPVQQGLGERKLTSIEEQAILWSIFAHVIRQIDSPDGNFDLGYYGDRWQRRRLQESEAGHGEIIISR